MIDFSKLIDVPYLLNPTPGYQFTFATLLTIIFSLALVAGIGISVIPTLRKQLWAGPIAQWLRWLGGIGLVLVFTRTQGLTYLSMRINYYFLALGFLGWLVVIVRNIRAVQSKLPEKVKRYETFEKYLPRSNN